MKKILILLLACILSVSCVHNTDINAFDEDGYPVWVTDIPVSSKKYYGIGSAKLSNDRNSLSSAEANASADVARKLEKTMKQASAVYTNDSSGQVMDAFEEITIQTVNITMRGIVKEKQWKAPDGTWWVLVSFSIKDVDKTFELEANKYQNKFKEKALSIEAARAESLKEIEELKNDFSRIQGQIDIMKADKETDTAAMVQALTAKQNALMQTLKDLMVSNNVSTVDALVGVINSRSDSEAEKVQQAIDSVKPSEFSSSIAEEFIKAGYELRNAD